MERSHYQAKGSYFKNTRHGGGVKKSNALHEMFDWFYRTLGGEAAQREAERKAREDHDAEVARKLQEDLEH